MSFDWVRYLTLAQDQVALSKQHTDREDSSGISERCRRGY
jgi:hypothetical protein